MATPEPESEASPSSPGKVVGRKQLILFGAGLLLIVVLSVAGTVVLFSDNGADSVAQQPRPEARAELERLNARLEQQNQELVELREEVRLLRSELENDRWQPALADQEERFQQFLGAMKEGMTDLANMLRGSRTWLEEYGGRLEQARSASEEREEALSQSASGPMIRSEVVSEPADR